MEIKEINKKEEKEYRGVKDVLEDLAKAQRVVDKLWFELWRFYKWNKNKTKNLNKSVRGFWNEI